MVGILTAALNGLLIGLLYALIALTFIIIYRSSRVFNFAQGELIVVAAFLIWTAAQIWPQHLWVAVGAAAITVLFVGLVIERLVIRPLVGADTFTYIMVTIGLLLFLQGFVLVLWGPEIHSFPAVISLRGIVIGPIILDRALVYGGVTTVAATAALMLYYNRTLNGLGMTAVSESHEIALTLGVSVNRAAAVSWVLSVLLSICAAIMFLNGKGLSFASADVALVALPAVLLAGLESIGGVLIAGPVIGISAQLGAYWLDPLVGGGVAQVLPFVFMIAILLVKPTGLFGWRAVERL